MSIGSWVRLGLLATLVSAGALRAQNPTEEQPHRRVRGGTVDELIDRGLRQLRTGHTWEARRSFREVSQRAPDRAVGYLGMSLGTLVDNPRAAAMLTWKAFMKRFEEEAEERAVVLEIASAFALTGPPDPADERFDRLPDPESWTTRGRDLARSSADWGAAMLRVHSAVSSESAEPQDPRAFVEIANGRLTVDGQIPFTIPGYETNLRKAAPDDAGLLARLPRHPFFTLGRERSVGLPDGSRSGELQWQPRRAPGFDLVRGLGGRRASEDYAGKPYLVVFFLGFG